MPNERTFIMGIRSAFIAAVVAAALSAPSLAHHSVPEKFDADKVRTLTGVLTKIEWANPHLSVFMNVKDASGKIVNWHIEFAPPNSLKSIGLDKNTLDLASPYTIEIWPARDGSANATGRTLTLPNGRKLNVADSLNWKPVGPDIIFMEKR